MFLTDNIPFKPNQAQQLVLDHCLLESGFHCILQMATGSGKTWLASHVIQKVIAQGLRAIYVCPTRALAAEVFDSWKQRLNPSDVGVFTSDYLKNGSTYPVSFEQAKLLIMTPERLDACTRHWRSHWSWIPELDLIVVDEFHLIGDGSRGGRLEGGLMRMRRLNPFMRIVCLSATLGNREELSDWLKGVEFASDWRPVPLKWNYVSFRKAEDKPRILVETLAPAIKKGGKSLVFTQSRRRAEMLAHYLRDHGFNCAYHHGALAPEQRKTVERSFRDSDLDVIVTTSTLEVGLNLPARHVVLYDLQEFNGNEYTPLKTSSVWQRVGRAGRFGLDSQGEATLFYPAWEKSPALYEKGKFERCYSALCKPFVLIEQIIAEIGSGLSRTRTELKAALSASLAAHQSRLPSIDVSIQEMIDAGLLVEQARADLEELEVRLKTTPLARIALRHMLSPQSILAFNRALSLCPTPSILDVLLIACASPDCTPIFPVDFEEIPELADQLKPHRSHLLTQDIAGLCESLSIRPRRLLSAVKMALTIWEWTQCGDFKLIKDRTSYDHEVLQLVDSLVRLIAAFAAVAQLPKTDESITPNLAQKIKLIGTMVQGGIDEHQVSLTLIPGIGTKWAKQLNSVGIADIEDLAQAESEEIAIPGRLTIQRASEWINTATSLLASDELMILRQIAPRIQVLNSEWPVQIDPYRLKRAISLKIRADDTADWLVSGGSDPHVVMQYPSWRCDCVDFAKGNLCKHILRARLHLNDPELLQATEQILHRNQNQSLDLTMLWIR